MRFCHVRDARVNSRSTNNVFWEKLYKYKGHIHPADHPPFTSLSNIDPWMTGSHPHDYNSLSPNSDKWAFSRLLSKRLLFQKTQHKTLIV